MSSFIQVTKHPDTGEFEPAFWIDDYFSPHRYGVIFKDGTLVDPWITKIERNDDYHDFDWKDYPAVETHRRRSSSESVVD